ncbi:hypothetical protein HPP92_006372 [Vanilla planifolia]|uniref:non-specific serine/threonine protein kinase n=1 Tax=Vanilla planifolia TaxID=51239 RepID=A0A835RIA5_VANPL|nr:hypothetical protein HPP92_006372 [Vanilla planifolia]
MYWILLCFLILPFLPFFASAQQDQFIYTGFAGIGKNNNVSLNGISEIENSGILRLTNETSRLIGRVFYPRPLRFKNSSAVDGKVEVASFSTSFAFAIVPEYPKLGGHGFAFVLSPNQNLTGAQPSQYLGLLNSSDNGNTTNHVFAIEFDTVQDFEFQDINDNHVGVDVDSLVSSTAATASYFDSNSGGQQPLNLKSGNTILAWIDYDGKARVLNVTLSPISSKPTKPLFSIPIDLSPVIEDDMFVGFSASTGLLASSHYLFGWSFKMNGAAPSLDLSSLPSLPRVSSKRSHAVIAVSASLSTVIVVLIAASLIAYALYRLKTVDIIEPWELEYGPHRFSYKTLHRATKGFRDRELLGVGGFGKVYKGVLPGSGEEVAVKRISHDSRQGIREFVAEIASIGRLRHRNLVQLQGWCRHRGDLLLVYDYMPNGSLDQFLFAGDPAPRTQAQTIPLLTWEQRFRILRGVASALLYLHEEWENVVIHRDVKASNVLLDADLNGRLGDFGLAKLHEHGANPSTTRVVGTLGYLAPELTRMGKATASSDVFAFGALVLEVVCGRRPIEAKALPEELVLVDWVWGLWNIRRWSEALDPKLDGKYDVEEAEVAIKVGLLCSQPLPMARPTMREVSRYLNGADTTEVPNIPPPPPSGLYEYDATPVSGMDKTKLGFEDFVHSYPSSSFEKVSACSLVSVSGDEESLSGYARIPLSA